MGYHYGTHVSDQTASSNGYGALWALLSSSSCSALVSAAAILGLSGLVPPIYAHTHVEVASPA